MTSTRSRLAAAALCAVVAIIAWSLYLLSESPAPQGRLSEVNAVAPPMLIREPPPARSMSLPRVEAAGQFATSVPDVAPTAAPGVAFNYRYAFRLAAPRIAAVQEEHVQQLRAARRRALPGHRPALSRGQRRAPSRRGSSSSSTRRSRAGSGAPRWTRWCAPKACSPRTRSAAPTPAERSPQRAAASPNLTAELARIEARLRGADGGFGGAGRARISGARAARADPRASRRPRGAAGGAGDHADAVPLWRRRARARASPSRGLRAALARAGDNFASGISVLLIVLITLLPWALTALAAWLLIRFARRRWFPAPAQAA